MTWNPASWATLGGSIGWEQYDYSQTAANQTNEFQAKFFATGHPTDWLAIRFNELVSWRGYENYNWQQFVGNVMLAGPTTERALSRIRTFAISTSPIATATLALSISISQRRSPA